MNDVKLIALTFVSKWLEQKAIEFDEVYSVLGTITAFLNDTIEFVPEEDAIEEVEEEDKYEFKLDKRVYNS